MQRHLQSRASIASARDFLDIGLKLPWYLYLHLLVADVHTVIYKWVSSFPARWWWLWLLICLFNIDASKACVGVR